MEELKKMLPRVSEKCEIWAAIVAPVSLRKWRREKPFSGPVMDSRSSGMRPGSFWQVMVFPFFGTPVQETKRQMRIGQVNT